MTISRRSLLVAGLAAGGALAARPSFGQAAKADELRIVQPWEFRTLRLAEAGFTYARAGITETLVSTTVDGRTQPGLAQSWAVSEDGLAWRFRLRPAQFHDGTALTAAAAKAALERLLPQSLYLKRVGIAAIEAEGADLTLKLARPFGPLLAYLVDNSAAILAPASFDAAGEIKALIGTGPFRIAALDLPRAMTLARHDAYWGERAKVASVRYDAVANGDTRSNIAAANDADLVFNITAPSLARVAASGMKVERVVIPRVHNLMLNCARAQFADVAVRRALSMAVDRQGIAAGIMRNPALAATQYVPPTLPDWQIAGKEPYRLDLARANALLDAAGWTRGEGGIRAKGGVRFAGLLRTFPNRPELPVIATALQAQWKAVGFDLSISVGEWQAIYEGQKDGTLDLGLSSRNMVIVPDPISSIALDFTSDVPAPGASGITNWTHDGLRRDVAAYLGEADEGRRAALRRAIAGVIHDEVPIIPIVWYDQIVATHPRISGFVNDPLEQRYYLDRIAIKA
jgi:peptide/nickel transport system substrate-binding protein